jgi:hypothetical protein
MPAPVPLPIRQAMRRRLEHGATVTQLSQDFGIAPRTVRNLVRAWRGRPESSVTPAYVHRPSPPPPPDHPAYEPALLLRREHPGWGAVLIRIYLDRQGVRPLPASRTLQRWFSRAGLGPAPPGRRPEVSQGRAAAPHEIWEVDAAEEIRLGNGATVSWLRIADEFTGAVLHTAVFPPRALEFRPGDRHPGTTASGVRPLGTPAARAGGQRRAVGLDRGTADRTGAVADRVGGGRDLEPGAMPSSQRRGRAVAGHG